MIASLNSLEIYLHYLVFFSTLILFAVYIYRTYSDMPKKEDISHQWLLTPATILHHVFNKVFGKHDGTITSLITFQSISITFLISISANLLCILLILSNSPKDFNIDINTISLFFSSYLVFLMFNFLGDLVSISFTRHVLYKISKKNMRLRKYIFQDIIGIFLGYMMTMLPIIILILLYSLNTNAETINYLKEIGFIGPIFIPFSLLVFSTTSTVSTIFIILASIAILSIAIPTFLFMLTILLLHFISKINITKNAFSLLLINFLQKFLTILGFFILLIYVTKEGLK